MHLQMGVASTAGAGARPARLGYLNSMRMTGNVELTCRLKLEGARPRANFGPGIGAQPDTALQALSLNRRRSKNFLLLDC
jgi:hypothetical protein